MYNLGFIIIIYFYVHRLYRDLYKLRSSNLEHLCHVYPLLKRKLQRMMTMSW